ncbi:MAG: AMP-binding protein [Gemmatimonadaceae bacterium]|nr:AMP-binding protein [Gemmatimonadaceae bacterium]
MLLLDRPEHAYPARLNCVAALLDARVAAGHGARPCFHDATTTWSYAETAAMVDRLAHVLVRVHGLVPGARVLLHGFNGPLLAACYLAIMKAGAVTVATMPLLRASELQAIVTKAQPSVALCDVRLVTVVREAIAGAAASMALVTLDGLREASEGMTGAFTPCDTASDDVCLLGFTSGTTGAPKATMHFHRDVLAVVHAYGAQVLRLVADDVVIGSPPLAFTFGLGGLVLFPLAAGASSVLLEKAPPDELLPAIARHRATVTFTAPAAYRAMLPKLAQHDVSSLRRCVSAGETLSAATFEAWRAATGIPIMDGIGATELLHIFIGSPAEDARAGVTGRVVPGYEARVVDEAGAECARGTAGLLEVRGPTGCRYLDDPRQRDYVREGWNRTGDSFIHDVDGTFRYQARADDMITAAGYNIAGPEVEGALLTHEAVAECAVVGAVGDDRTMVVAAYVVLRAGHDAGEAMTLALQAHVRDRLAPFKAPRLVAFVPELPKTSTGKVQRAVLRERARALRSGAVSSA